MNQVYNDYYYNQHKKNSLINRLFIHLVDRKEPILSHLKKIKPEGSKLLDIGCGNGLFLSHVEHHYKCTGVDTSKAGLELARKRTKQAKIKELSCYHLTSLTNGNFYFDIVTCFDVLEHCIDPKETLRQIRKVLKPDGILAVSFPNTSCVSLKLKRKSAFCFKDKTHIWFYTPSQWEFLFQENGLIPIRQWYGGLIDPPYFKHIPSFLQNWLIKYPTQGLSVFGFPLPNFLGEEVSMLCIKNDRKTD